MNSPDICIYHTDQRSDGLTSERREFEMSREDFDRLIDGINSAWCELGRRMGFDGTTALPVPGRGGLFFTAVPTSKSDGRTR